MAQSDNDSERERDTVEVIPLLAETAGVERRFRTTGKVRISTRVETEHQTLTEELRGENIEIERVPCNVPVEAIPKVRTEDGVTIIPLVEERLFVEKRLVLVEEVRLRRVETKEQVSIPVELRTERAVIERIDPETDETPNRS